MRTVRVMHNHEPGYGWSFDSPDIQGFIGGPKNDADFDASCRWAEEAVRLTLEFEAEERGDSQVEEAHIVHLVETPATA